MPCRVLITGIEGFTARHLAASLRADPGLRVLGTGRRDRTTSPVDGYQPCDITDRDAVRALVAWARPDVVYHLAGLRGDASEVDMHAVNVGGFELLRTALRHSAAGRPVRLLVIGSAAEIGPVGADHLPVDETVTCRPITAYGRSKHAMVAAAVAEPAGSGVEVVVARTFNLVGAGLDRGLAPGGFAAAVRAVARGDTTTVRCGWLDGRRDYLDVGDAVRAYRLLADHGPPGAVVNVCSGRSVRMGDLLDRLLAIAGVQAKVIAATAPGPHDVPDIRGSHAKLSTLTGWQSQVGLEASLAALYAQAS